MVAQQQSSTTVLILRERGVYTAIVNGTRRYWIASDTDRVGCVLYTPDEWIDGSSADWEIDDQGRLAFQGDPIRGGGLTADDLTDTGFDVEDDAFRATVGARPSLGTDWPVVAEILRCEPGQTDEGEPVAWWVRTICNGSADGEGFGASTFDEAVTYATSDTE